MCTHMSEVIVIMQVSIVRVTGVRICVLTCTTSLPTMLGLLVYACAQRLFCMANGARARYTEYLRLYSLVATNI